MAKCARLVMGLSAASALARQAPACARNRADVFNTFAAAKRLYVDRLKAGKIESPTGVDKVHQRVMDITGEPLPYGITPNRQIIEDLIGHARTQGIITRPVTVEDLFARGTHALVA